MKFIVSRKPLVHIHFNNVEVLGFNQVDTLPSSSLYRSNMVEVSVVIPIDHPFYVGSLEPNHFFSVQDLL